MAYNPVTDTPFPSAATVPADTLLVSNIPSTIRTMMARINEVAAGLYSNSSVIGTISIWGTGTPPANYLECNGQALGAYPALAAIYGSTAPDYRGWFLRGWAHGKNSDNGTEIDINRAINSKQTWMVGTHSHSYDRFADQGGKHVGQGSGTVGPNQGNNTGASGGNDNRPSNIAVMYIIRYQ